MTQNSGKTFFVFQDKTLPIQSSCSVRMFLVLLVECGFISYDK